MSSDILEHSKQSQGNAMSDTEQQVTFSMQMDDFCLDVALILRRILDLDPAPGMDEDRHMETSLPTGVSEEEVR